MTDKPVVHCLGLGPGPLGLLTLESLERMERAPRVLVRTARHPVVDELRERGVFLESLDNLYEGAEDLGAVYRAIAARVAEEALREGETVYAVPGHPLAAEATVRLLLADERVSVKLYPALSFLDAAWPLVGFDPIGGFQLVDVGDLGEGGSRLVNPRLALLIAQVDSRLAAADAKITLLEVYPPEHIVQVVRRAGLPEASCRSLPLCELDREEIFDHLTSVFVPALPEEQIFDFRRLTDLISVLRGPEGCPWDRAQTHESLARHMVEESYEAIDAIQRDDPDHLAEELGDILLQVVLHAQLGREEGTFDVRDTLRSIITKLILRHPHVFGETRAGTPEEVIANWEKIKAGEKGHVSVMEGVSEGLPALLYAYKLQARAARIGFDWQQGEEVLPKLQEELEELRASLLEGGPGIEDELGDLFFTLINICRHWRIDPEIAVHKAGKKFARRFSYVEELAAREGLDLSLLSLEELDALWERSKRAEEPW